MNACTESTLKKILDSVYQKLINERRDIDSQLHRHKEKAVGIGESLPLLIIIGFPQKYLFPIIKNTCSLDIAA